MQNLVFKNMYHNLLENTSIDIVVIFNMYLSNKGKENWNHIDAFASLSQNINHIYRGCSEEFWVYFWDGRNESKSKTEKKFIASY
jgi:hypothetical protein